MIEHISLQQYMFFIPSLIAIKDDGMKQRSLISQ